MRRLHWVLIGCAATAAYFAAAGWLKVTYDPITVRMPPSVAGRIIRLYQPFVDLSKFAVMAPDHAFASVADSACDLDRSPVVIYENDTALEPHAPHPEITTKGMGRASHFRSSDNPMLFGGRASFLFSSTDNTDPRTNGRAYWAVRPEGTIPDEIACPAAPEEEIDPMPNGKLIFKLQGPFETFAGSHMAVAHGLDALAELADDPDNKNQSPIILYEDGLPLGRAHSSHPDIASIGEGRFSHWKTQGMVFSSSDNSDPNTNGRTYWAINPERQSLE